MATSYNANIGTAIIQIFLNNESLKKGLDEAKAKVTSFVKSVNEWANFAMKIGTAVTTPFAFSIRTFAAFDDKMRQVQAVTAETGVAFERLTEYAKKLGRETAFTATQVSDGMLALGRMGFNAAEIQNATKHVMNLSIVTGTELGTAAEIAANNMRVFGLEADKTETVADILAVTANSSAQTLTDLGEALKMAGPHAARAGADITDTAAALGILANMGIRGSLAGTALGKSYKQLADTKIAAYLRSMGVETLNADGSMRRMKDTLLDIAKAMASMTNAEQINFAETVFDARGSLGGGILAVNTSAIDSLIRKLGNANGEAERAAKTMEQGIGGSLRALASAAEGIAIAFAEVLSTVFVPLVQSISSALLYTRELIAEYGGMIAAIAKVAAMLALLGASLKTVTITATALNTVVKPAWTVIKFVDTWTAANITAASAQKLLAPATEAASGAIAQKTAAEIAETTATTASTVATETKTTAEVAETTATAAETTAVTILTKDLAALTTAKLFATAASKKHAASVLAASTSEMMAAKTTAGASMMRKAAYITEITASKALAAATLGVTKAFAIMAAHPIIAMITAVIAAFGIWIARAKKTENENRKIAESFAKIADQKSKFREDGDQKRVKANQDFERLKQLENISKQTKLTAEEMKEAEEILNRLNPFGSKRWANIDKLSNSLHLAASAQNEMNREMEKAAKIELEAEVKAQQQAIEKLHQAKRSGTGWQLASWATLGAVDNGTETNKNIDKEIEEKFAKLRAAKLRLKAIEGGSKAAVTGEKEKSTEERIEAEKLRKQKTEEEIADIKKKLADIDEKNARDKRTAVENEINDLRKLRDEYKKNINVLLEEQKTKLEIAQENLKNNPENGTRMQQSAHRDAAEAVTEAQKNIQALTDQAEYAENEFRSKELEIIRKQQQKQEKQLNPFTSFLNDFDTEEANRKKNDEIEQTYNKAVKNEDYKTAAQFINNLIQSMNQTMETARQEYQRKLQAYTEETSEGGQELSEAEIADLREIQNAIKENANTLNNYTDKLAQISEAKNAALETPENTVKDKAAAAVGSWSLSALSGMLGGAFSPMERTARATEQTASAIRKNNAETAETNKKLDAFIASAMTY